MTSLIRHHVRTFIALFSTALVIHGAEMELLPGNTVRVGVESDTSERVAIDVSSNLVNWMQLTNVAPKAGKVTFANRPPPLDPGRFFRISDGDDTFWITGFVDGGNSFGGIAGVKVTEFRSGASVTTDANGFFSFEQRFFRTNLPIFLRASLEGFGYVDHPIDVPNAGSFLVIPSLLTSPPGAMDPIDTTFHFKVISGPRAGLEYSMRCYDLRFEMSGGISGNGIFSRPATTSPWVYLDVSPGVRVPNQVLIWLGGLNETYGRFSGIPSPKGTLPGNGIVTMEHVVFSPSTLSGLTFSIGTNQIRFTERVYNLTWDGVATFGEYSAARNRNLWTITLIGNGSPRYLQFYFLSPTNGTFGFEAPDGNFVKGDMRQIAGPSPNIIAPSVPPRLTISPSSSLVGEVPYTIMFTGGSTGIFTSIGSEGEPIGNGSYTYTANAHQAHLHMDYTLFPGDYDDISLTFKAPAGSTLPSSFTGTQRSSQTVGEFTGTFTY